MLKSPYNFSQRPEMILWRKYTHGLSCLDWGSENVNIVAYGKINGGLRPIRWKAINRVGPGKKFLKLFQTLKFDAVFCFSLQTE